MKTLKKIPQVISQIRFVVFKRDTVDTRCLASLQSAERIPQQLFVEQREQVIENRVRLRFRSLVDVIQPGYHRGSVSEYGRCPVWITYWPGRLPCTDITRLHSIRLVTGLQRYYSAIRLPESHLPSLLIRLVRHTQTSMSGVSCFVKNLRVSLVALMTSCVARADERLRVSSHSLPNRGKRYCLPACTNLGQNPTDTKFRSSCRSPPRGHSRSIHPHYLSVYASTSHFEASPTLRLHAPYKLAATLDTEPLAKSYSDGISPRLSTNHFQSARSRLCYAAMG